MLKPGKNNAKIGERVTKRKWKGFPIYSLTLEERITCPDYCEQWDNCYGNNMPFAHRYDESHPDFLPLLSMQLHNLSAKHCEGFVVRLHILGDFFSEQYVEFWSDKIHAYDNLHVWGYTHHRATSPIGQAIQKLNTTFPDRWRIRFSDDTSQSFRSQVAKNSLPNLVTCPEQLNQTDSCATCAYCWSSEDPVVFIEH